jgi:hypothetical protein
MLEGNGGPIWIVLIVPTFGHGGHPRRLELSAAPLHVGQGPLPFGNQHLQ